MLGVDTGASIVFNSDGVLGMTPTTTGPEQLFVTQLFEGGLISENSFGVNYRETSFTSTILLGGWDTTIVANESLFRYVSLKSTNVWSLPLADVRYGNVSLKMDSERGVLDTGTSLTYFSEEDFALLYAKLSEGKTCGTSISRGYYACYCDTEADFKDIVFHMGSYYFYFPTSSYIEILPFTPNICRFLIDVIIVGRGAVNLVLMGDSFLRNYYVYHDVTNKRVGMYGTVSDGAVLQHIYLAVTLFLFLNL
jgi:hypothetical protein